MSILTRKAGVPQLRCRAMSGGKTASPFRYEVNVMGRWIASNYQFAAWVVDSGRSLVRESELVAMENEIIKPWAERFLDHRGVVVETIGVDIVNHRVLFTRSGYPYPCMQPRSLFSKKFKKVPA